jgi:tRNA threonylcarbamoyladenosine biosynthesis protein TsaE
MEAMKILTENGMKNLGEKVGAVLKGGEIIELIGDLGAGKTTFAGGLARGLEIPGKIQSPTFNIVLNYPARDDLELNHYDFYRLDDPGIMTDEIVESSSNSRNITLIEWGENVREFLPADQKITIKINYLAEDGREVFAKIPEKFGKIREIFDAENEEEFREKNPKNEEEKK